DLLAGEFWRRSLRCLQFVAVSASTPASCGFGGRWQDVGTNVGHQADNLLLDLGAVLVDPVTGPDEHRCNKQIGQVSKDKRSSACFVGAVTVAKQRWQDHGLRSQKDLSRRFVLGDRHASSIAWSFSGIAEFCGGSLA